MEEIWQSVEYVATILGILGGLLVAFKQRSGFIAWIFGNALWVIFGIAHGIWGLVLLFSVYEVISIISFWYWGKAEKGE